MNRILLYCLFFSFCDVHSFSNDVDQSWRIYLKDIDFKQYLPCDGYTTESLINEAVKYCHLANVDSPVMARKCLMQAQQRIRAKLARAQTFRNYMQRLLSDAVANADCILKAKSPDDSDGIDFAEFRAILGKQLSLSNMDNSQLLQFMEGNEENSFTDGLPDILKSQIETIARDYKDNTPNYSPNLQKVKLKVYLGTAAKPNLVSAEVQADAPAKPTLEVSSPAIVDEFDKPQETKLSLSDAVGVDKQLGNSKAKTPPASPVRRSPFLSQFQESIQQIQEPIQQTPSPRRGSRFSLDGKGRTKNGKGRTNVHVPTGDASKPRQKDFYLPRSPHDKDGASYPDSAEQRTQEAQAFRKAQQPKLDHVNQEARDAARRSQIQIPRAH